MSAPFPSSDRESIAAAAAQWTVRRDRGLSAAEAIEFELWMAADSRHGDAMQEAGGAWSLLDRTPEGFARRMLATAMRRRIRWRRSLAVGAFAVAAAVTVVAWTWLSGADRRGNNLPALLAAGPRVLTLADGSLVQLNKGGELVEQFTAKERGVRLTRGEAYFTVTKDSNRPFVVVAGTWRVRAVGTAFNVNVQTSQVEVIVTEGQVSLARPNGPTDEPLVEAGERAVLPRVGSPWSGDSRSIVISRLAPAEIDHTLAWHETLVRLGGATLAELAEEFERRFGQRMVIPDADVAQMRAGGRVRANDAESFATVLATTFELDVERATDGSWRLRKKKHLRDSGN